MTYVAMLAWISGWRTDPRYGGYEWHDWMVICMFGVAQVCIVLGMAASVAWLARARRLLAAAFWGISGITILGLTFAAVVASVLDSSFFGD